MSFLPSIPFRSALLITLALLGAGTVRAGEIRNTATLRVSAPGGTPVLIPSNTVTLRGLEACTPSVTPDGQGGAPSRVIRSAAPGTILIPYTVSVSGDQGGPVTLQASLLEAVDGVQVRVQDSAAADARELTTLTLNPGQSRDVTVAVTVTRALNATLNVNLAATCGARSDRVNVTQVQLQPEVALLLGHSVTPAATQPGDEPTFTLTLPLSGPDGGSPTLTVTLPAGLNFIPDSAQRGAQPVPATVSADGRQVTFTPGAVPAGQTLTVTYRARVGVDAVGSSGGDQDLTAVGVASLTGPDGRTTRSNEAAATVRVTPGVFDRRATLVGEVFLDLNGNGRRDPQDSPLAGARVLLASGVQGVTDEMGRYALRNLVPGPWLVTLDRDTAPFAPVPGFGPRVVDVFALTRVDFALQQPSAVTGSDLPGGASPSLTTVRRGPLLITRRVTATAAGGSVVTLTVSSARPVQDVVVTDRASQDSEERAFNLGALTDPVTLQYLTLTPAGSNDPDVLWREP
ncbi:hypothetical protein [Deinococcus depolymerans]|uniref:DUF11 domain-containing protein n=1 Tax=Deinococcus depolymerans TaxID=392408 RepID=A0ABN1C9L2_9DEIO